MLAEPRRIFVDINFDLYVADWWNDRVQLFKSEQQNGITVAGNNAPLNIQLNHPTAVFLDADGYLFIIDSWDLRILGSNSNGFYCLIGCSASYGGAWTLLLSPRAAAFDSYGNIIVSVPQNRRIQKFILITNVSGK
jgi:hypothetical protein